MDIRLYRYRAAILIYGFLLQISYLRPERHVTSWSSRFSIHLQNLTGVLFGLSQTGQFSHPWTTPVWELPTGSFLTGDRRVETALRSFNTGQF